MKYSDSEITQFYIWPLKTRTAAAGLVLRVLSDPAPCPGSARVKGSAPWSHRNANPIDQRSTATKRRR